MNMKIGGRYLVIATCFSLVDAIFTQEFESVKLQVMTRTEVKPLTRSTPGRLC
jgi:hypothetical protein